MASIKMWTSLVTPDPAANSRMDVKQASILHFEMLLPMFCTLSEFKVTSLSWHRPSSSLKIASPKTLTFRHMCE